MNGICVCECILAKEIRDRLRDYSGNREISGNSRMLDKSRMLDLSTSPGTENEQKRMRTCANGNYR